MKLKTLTIHNIASIEDATIDFSGPILSSQDLFLICGPTGSGKTTILDAICLALFNKTPRMERSSRREVINTFADTNTNTSNKLHDTLHMVRKNAVDAAITLVFEVDSHEYTACWRALRKGQYRSGKESKTFGKLSLEEKISKRLDYEWTLTDDQGHEYKKEVEKEVANIIRMNFDQFCKTTMLAQGDFTKFLGSSSDEKAQILEKLVGTEQYAAVGRVINRTTIDKKNEMDALGRELANFVFLTDEQITEKQDEMAKLDNSIREISGQKTAIDKRLQWIDESSKAVEAETRARAALAEATRALLTDEAVAAKDTVQLWDATTDVRKSLATRIECRHTSESCTDAANRLAVEYDRAVAAQLSMTAACRALLDTNKRIKAMLDDQRRFEPMFAKADVICSMHNAIIANDKMIAGHIGLLQECDNKLKDLDATLRKLEQQKKDITAQIESLEESAHTHTESLAKYGANTIDEETDALSRRRGALVEARHALQMFNDATTDLGNKKTAVAAAVENLRKAEIEETRTAKEAELATRTANESQELYSKAYLSLDNHARALRAKINVGDSCPVCGNIVEQLLDESELKAALKPLDDKRNADAETARAATTAHARATATMANARAALTQSESDATRAGITLDSRRKTLTDKCLSLGLEPRADGNDLPSCAGQETFDAIQNEIDESAKAIATRQQQIKIIRNLILADNTKAMNLRRTQLAEIEKQITGIRNDIATEGSRRAQTAGAIDNARANTARRRSEIAELVYPDWQPSQPDRFYEDLHTAAVRYADNNAAYNNNLSTIATLTQNLEFIGDCRRKTESLFPFWSAHDNTVPRETANAVSIWNNIASEAGIIADTLRRNDERCRAAQNEIDAFAAANPQYDMKAIEGLLAVSGESIAQKRSYVQFLTETLSKARAIHDEAVARKAAYAQSPLAPDDTPESLKEQSEALSATVGKYAETKGRLQLELDIDRQNRQAQGRKKAEYDAKCAEYAQWETLNKYLGNTDGKNFRNVAQSFILTELLDKANAYLYNISNRYTLFCHPGTLTIMMRDAYQGGAERATNTLSGGESFIISLSLALGLSSMQNVDFEVDTLFIDEGFGTLSPEFLDPVITALKRLNQTYGRRVGIISHVDALKQRIRASIDVSRHGTSGSRIDIVFN